MDAQTRLESYKKTLLDIIHKYLPDCKVYLFGSRARQTNREGADIDLALDAGKKIDFSILANISADIEDTTIPVLIDVVDIHTISKEMINEIEKDKVEWA